MPGDAGLVGTGKSPLSDMGPLPGFEHSSELT